MHKILNNDSLPLASNGTTSRLLRQEEHALAVLVLARIIIILTITFIIIIVKTTIQAKAKPRHLTPSDVGELCMSELDRAGASLNAISLSLIIVIIRGSSHYATCMPLPSDTFHHIWGRRSYSCHLALDFATRVACWGNFCCGHERVVHVCVVEVEPSMAFTAY